MNQWMQKQPIQGADLKEGDGGGGMCVRLCVCVSVVVLGGGITTMRSLVASNGEQVQT